MTDNSDDPDDSDNSDNSDDFDDSNDSDLKTLRRIYFLLVLECQSPFIHLASDPKDAALTIKGVISSVKRKWPK